LALATGCRGDDDSGADGGNGGGDGGGGGEVTIFDIQNESMPAGTAVTVRGVVITAIDTYGGRTGAIYVQEPEGGAFSGVVISLTDATGANFSVGDLVDVENGLKDEFALSDDTTGRTITQIGTGSGFNITKVGDGTVPDPEVVLPWDLATDDDEAEKWEGVLVKFENVSALTSPFGVTMTDDTLKEMRITGPFLVSSSLTELADTIMREDCFAEVVGIGDYFFNYKLLPRSSADLVTGGTGCPAPEAGDTACMDTEDNDYDGFTDCEDISCQDLAMCVEDTDVISIQNDTIDDGTIVSVTDAVVTAIDEDGLHLWVQDEVSPAMQHNGVYLFRGDDAEALTTILVGDKVDFVGRKTNFFGETQVEDAVVTDTDDTGNISILTGGDTAVIGDMTTGKPWEGTLVTLENVQITDINPDAPSEFGQFLISNSTAAMYVDDELDFAIKEDASLTMDQCLASITGIVIYDTFDDYYFLSPRNLADVDTTAGTCN
jgi:hypothetical protein